MLDRIFIFLQPVSRLITRHPARIIAVSLLFAFAGLILALNLQIDTDYSKLIPEHYPSVEALNKLREQVGSSNELAVVIESPSFDLNKNYAEDLIPRVMQLKNHADGSSLFTRFEFRKEVDFLQSNALYFATNEELDLLESFLDEEIEKARLEVNPFYFDFDNESDQSDSLGRELENAYNELIGSEYPVSEDSLVLAIRFYPGGSQTDIQYIRHLYSEVDRLTRDLLTEYEDSGIRIVLAGRLLRSLIEVDSIYLDVRNSFGSGVIMLLILVMAFFLYKNYTAHRIRKDSVYVFLNELKRMPLTAIIIGIPLIISLCWTFGLTWLIYQTLNIMTSTLGLLLFGMGIDFGIHFYARYIEERGEGSAVNNAIETTFMTTGRAIMAVGITTSAAFFILMLADFKGFSEFGFISGFGILFAIISMTIVLPSCIVLLEQFGWLPQNKVSQKRLTSKKKDVHHYSRDFKVLALIVAGISISATLLAGWYTPNLSFEYDFGTLEPTYESYNEAAREARKVYSDRSTRNAAYIIADNARDAVEIRNLLNNYIETDTLSPTIRSVETLQDRYPFTIREQETKLSRINEIRNKLDDPFLSGSDSEIFDRLVRSASTTEPIQLQSVPEFILEPFTAKDGTIGNLVIIYPSVGLSDGRNSMNFADDLKDITLNNGKVYYAGSTSIVASDMLRLMIREAPWMIALTLTFIIIIKALIFRRVKWLLLALIPLVASFFWLFGFMELAGWKLNFYNIVVLPTILGIGDDSGIHIIHRYIEEGSGSIAKVLRSTGEHVSASAFTTMLGFTGLLFSNHPGMRSIGELAVLGIGLMLIASLTLLPALLYLLENRKKL